MPGDQVFFTYGRRSNGHLLLHYSFAYEGNKYEFQPVVLNMRPASKAPEHLLNEEEEPK